MLEAAQPYQHLTAGDNAQVQHKAIYKQSFNASGRSVTAGVGGDMRK